MSAETQVDHSTCSATGCCMLGTATRSPGPECSWYCFIHVAARPDEVRHITDELNRLRWIVDIVRTLRAGQPLTDIMQQNFALAQRSDLKQSEREDRAAWMIRLEGVLAQSCRDSLVQP
ncbi:MAG: hypothetical protein V4631_22200 [Pseudomonadota bacterium]